MVKDYVGLNLSLDVRLVINGVLVIIQNAISDFTLFGIRVWEAINLSSSSPLRNKLNTGGLKKKATLWFLEFLSF